jgi:hypothetical protein
MTSAHLERAELLFRRQVALDAKAPLRNTISQIDAVPMLVDSVAQPNARQPFVRVPRPGIPTEPLLASPGHFNASRIPPGAATWLFLVGRRSNDTLEKIVLELCNIQSAKKSFRPVFILEMAEHIEIARKYGFTFEYISSPEEWGQSHDEQIEFFKLKWGAQFCLNLSKQAASSSLSAATSTACGTKSNAEISSEAVDSRLGLARI